MGNFRQQMQWLTKPTWFDFALVVVVWTMILGSFAFLVEKWWGFVILAFVYVVVVYSAYRHVREYQDKQKKQE